jgi:hypothetical protein
MNALVLQSNPIQSNPIHYGQTAAEEAAKVQLDVLREDVAGIRRNVALLQMVWMSRESRIHGMAAQRFTRALLSNVT